MNKLGTDSNADIVFYVSTRTNKIVSYLKRFQMCYGFEEGIFPFTAFQLMKTTSINVLNQMKSF